jgi:hypothetical protein
MHSTSSRIFDRIKAGCRRLHTIAALNSRWPGEKSYRQASKNAEVSIFSSTPAYAARFDQAPRPSPKRLVALDHAPRQRRQSAHPRYFADCSAAFVPWRSAEAAPGLSLHRSRRHARSQHCWCPCTVRPFDFYCNSRAVSPVSAKEACLSLNLRHGLLSFWQV